MYDPKTQFYKSGQVNRCPMTTLLPYARLAITMKSTTELVLPIYKGATLRGLLTTGLRHAHCPPERHDLACHACPDQRICAYAVLDQPLSGDNITLPRPYALDAAQLTERLYQEGQRLTFYLSLYGPAVRYVEQVIQSLRHWPGFDVKNFKSDIPLPETARYARGNHWFRGCMALVEVDLYSNPIPLPAPIHNEEITSANGWHADIFLASPCRPLKGKKKPLPIRKWRPEHLFESIARTISEFRRHYCGVPATQADMWSDEARAAVARIEMDATEAADIELRRSKRIGTKLGMDPSDGAIGPVTLTNIPQPLLPWLVAAQALQIGKLTTHGFGVTEMAFFEEGLDQPMGNGHGAQVAELADNVCCR